MKKICVRCKEEKELDCFRNSKAHEGGKFHTCKDCMNGYYKTKYANNKQIFLDRNHERRNKWRDIFFDLKSKSKCCECGETHMATLDFHHKDQETKDFTLGRIWSKYPNEANIQLLKEEISKCIVLCSNCHRKLHWNANDAYKEFTE